MKKLIKFLKAKYRYYKKGRYDLIVWHTHYDRQYREVLRYMTKAELDENIRHLNDHPLAYDRIDKMKIRRPAR